MNKTKPVTRLGRQGEGMAKIEKEIVVCDACADEVSVENTAGSSWRRLTIEHIKPAATGKRGRPSKLPTVDVCSVECYGNYLSKEDERAKEAAAKKSKAKPVAKTEAGKAKPTAKGKKLKPIKKKVEEKNAEEVATATEE